MEHISMHLELYLKDNGKVENKQERGHMNSLMEVFMKESGKIIK